MIDNKTIREVVILNKLINGGTHKAYETRTATGSIASFETNTVKELVSCKTSFEPIQASGTPTPSSPISIYGHTGLNIYKAKKNLANIKPYTNWDIIGNAYAVQRNACPQKPLKAVFLDKDTTIDLTGCYLGFVDSTYESGSLQTNNYRWIINNGIVASILDNYPVNNDTNKRLDGLIIYPRTEETYNKIFARYDVMCVLPTETATTYEAYNGTTYPVSWSEHGTIYGGYYNSVTGELWKTHEAVDLSTLTWTSSGSGTAARWYCGDLTSFIQKPTSSTQILDMTMEQFRPINYGVSLANYPDYISVLSDGRLISYKYDDNSPSGLCVYPLATPVKVADLDPLELVSRLGVNNIWSDIGDMEVKYQYEVEVTESSLMKYLPFFYDFKERRIL